MPTISTVDRALNLALEVASYRSDYNEQLERRARKLASGWNAADAGSYSESARDHNLTVGFLAYEALNHSYVAIQQADRHLAPKGRVAALTRRTLTMTACAGTPAQPVLEDVFDDCCLAAELKFVQGLEYHRLGKRPNPSHVAALVLNDTKGEPFAYQKAVGHPYAYVWRDGILQTHAGPRSLLAGSIVKPIYNRDSHGQPPPHEKFAGVGIVGIAGSMADDVEFKRFGLQLVPKAIRTAALLDVSMPDAYEEYRHHVDETVAMNNTVFADSIAELVKTNKDYFVAEM
jgi:hypothetical protein